MPERQGILYIVTIPPGNLQDLTLRARRVLGQVEAVVANDRHAAAELLTALKIETPAQPLGKDYDALIKQLQDGAELALVYRESELIPADSTAEFVPAVIRAGIRVEPIPGASAILSALVASGIAAPRFRFIGQLPTQAAARKRKLEALRGVREPMVFFITPNRLASLLHAMRGAFGDERRSALACNLTLPDELFVRGSLSEILAQLKPESYQGDVVLVLEGNTQLQKHAR